jgi:CRISPR-associated protein Csm4
VKTYQIKLTTHSGILTPFQADTIFGHLCWVVTHREGESGLQEFLKLFKEKNPPFVISDGFPGELLPKPLSVEFNVDPEERKEIRKINYITLEDFNRIRKGEKCKLQPVESFIKTSLTPHNTVNRLTNTTPAEGGMYSLEEFSVPEVTIYMKAVSEEWKNRSVGLFKELSKSGYGRKKSIGKGQFYIKDVKEFEDFDRFEGSDGFVTFSNFCPAENDPTDGLYKTFVKYGKLGEEFTFCGNPFKKPLVMVKTGSVFKADGPPKEFYGRIVEDISPVKPEVVHYGFAFAVAIKLS